MIGNRSGLIVWIHQLKQGRILRKYGHVHYISKRMKYAILYCETEKLDAIIRDLESLRAVKRVEKSYLQEIKTTYEKKRHFEEQDSYIQPVY